MKIRKVLYPTDFSTCARQALSHALFLSEQFNAELHLFHAIILHEEDPHGRERDFPEAEDILRRMFETADSEIGKLADEHEVKALKVREATRRGFSAGETILEYASEEDVDLIVMGTHGRRGAARLWFGSVAEEVVRFSKCPVMTLRELDEPRTVESIERILVPMDFSSYSRKALDHAAELAARYDAQLQIVHVIEMANYPSFYGGFTLAERAPEIERKAEAGMQELGEALPQKVHFSTHVLRGLPGTEIVEFAEEHGTDLIVTATHGLTGIERVLLGSTAEKILRLAKCPVFTLKAFHHTSSE